jgi:methylglutaconyl-CoA hydratase
MQLTQTLYEIDAQQVGRVTFNRPEKHNAINPLFMDELEWVMDDAVQNKLRALVLTGAGDSFCAGGDLAWMQEQMQLPLAKRVAGSAQLASFLTRLDELPMLTIARVNGPAYGGGVGVISACDMAFTLSSARFALTEVRLGLAPSNISPFVVKRMGAANARRTFLNAKMMDAALAQQLGLITEVSDDLDASIDAELRSLFACGPEAVAAVKKLIAFVDNHQAEQNSEYTALDLAQAWGREESQEGIQAFFDKRRPSWRT